jgi:hypothetical protein
VFVHVLLVGYLLVSLTARIPVRDSQLRRLVAAQTFVCGPTFYAVAEVRLGDSGAILPPCFVSLGVFAVSGSRCFTATKWAG